MEKNELYKQQKVVDYTHDGLGIIKIDNFPVFVPYTKIGEEVDVHILKVKKNIAFGRSMSLNKEETAVKCPHFFQCGGCQIQHFTIDEQTLLKKNGIIKTFSKQQIELDDIELQTGEPFFYRNKVVAQLFTENRQIKWGLFKTNSHNIVGIDNCDLITERLNMMLNEICKLLTDAGEKVYESKFKRGNLESILLRKSDRTNEVLITIIGYQKKLMSVDYVTESLIEKYPEIVGIVFNQKANNTNKIVGEKETVLYGRDYIYEQLGDYKFPISSQSFFQVNTEMAEVMFNWLKENVDLTNKTVLDSYTGTGNIAALLAENSKKVVGVDINSQGIKSANQIKEEYQLNNLEFVTADINEYIKNSTDVFDTLIIDPPRKGIDKSFIDFIEESKIEEVVYISCNYSTLARDLKLLANYEIKKIKAFDLFSQTYHVEVVVILNRK